jgi:hypothetical protein
MLNVFYLVKKHCHIKYKPINDLTKAPNLA